MRIRREDVEHVRENSRIEEVVGEYVTLRAAGVGSMKGLCPFHDERTPSFHVRPHVGLWHCFGCGEGGDVISFVEKVEHVTFADAVERLAARLGFAVRYEDDGTGRAAARREQVGHRQRLIEANRLAAHFYTEQLSTSREAATGRRFLADRGFDQDAAQMFGIGFAPRGGESLLHFLRGKGVTEDDLVASGLAGQGQRGLYDRFRGRLLWPIRDVTGDVVGFGARRLFDDDRIEAKYLNTPETVLYHKGQVLYGVDLAKREIARTRQVVVVEGYTDVMACHLAGVETAVATCGTAFGADHIRIVRRLLGDDSVFNGEVVFTFDGDEAGQKAAMRAFADDQRFVAQTFVAVARDGMDPCDLRLSRGDQAVRDLVAARQPLFEFAIRTILRRFDLETAEGRIAALRAAAPVVARIRDSGLRPEYGRLLAGWLGLDVEPVARAVALAARSAREEATQPTAGRDRGSSTLTGGAESGRQRQPDPRSLGRAGSDVPRAPASAAYRIDPRDPVARVEREALECMLQVPALIPVEDADSLGDSAFEVPAYRAVHHAIRAAGGLAAASTMTPAGWAEAVRDAAPDSVEALVRELAVAPLPVGDGEALERYAVSLVLRVAEVQVTRQIGSLKSRVQRLETDVPAYRDDPAYRQAFADLLQAEAYRRWLRDRIAG